MGKRRLRRATLAAVGWVLLVCACHSSDARSVTMMAGDPDHADAETGARLAWAYGCGTCHVIPGVVGADAEIGPPLSGWSRRSYIAGTLPNEPDELVRWIVDPQMVEPYTAMPDLGVTEGQARHIAAYLYTLQ
jgi:cytochrome c